MLAGNIRWLFCRQSTHELEHHFECEHIPYVVLLDAAGVILLSILSSLLSVFSCVAHSPLLACIRVFALSPTLASSVVDPSPLTTSMLLVHTK